MSPEQLRVVILFGLFGLGLMFYAFRRMRVTRKVKDTPRSKVASAPQGYIEVEGFAWPVDKSSTLATGREIVYYSVQIQRQETRGSGKNKRKEWITVFSHCDMHPFYLVDETGLATINLQGCSFELDKSNTRRWGSLSDVEKNKLLELVGGRISGFPPTTFLFGLFATPYRVIENEIFVGSPLYLHGDFKSPSQDRPVVKPQGLGDFAKKVFDLAGRSRKNVNHLIDKNGDGKVTHEEAQAGYSLAATMARRKQDAADDVEFTVYGCMGSSQEHKLMLADAHEHHLVKRLGQNVVLSFVGGAILLSIAISQAIVDVPENEKLRITTRQMPIQKRQVASAPVRAAGPMRQPQEQMPLPNILHQACVQGDARACVGLIENKVKFNLSVEHATYYAKRACQLGESSHCSAQ